MGSNNGKRPSCGLCGGFCEGGKPDDFSIHIVSCSARVFVNRNTGFFMRFEYAGTRYSVDVVKNAYKTMIEGSGWEKFTSDNNLGGGSLVKFDMTKRPRKVSIAKFADGILIDTNTASSADGMDVDEEGSDDDADDMAGAVERTKGVCLNPQEESKLNAMVLELNTEILGRPVFHRLTRTNIAAANMKVPRRVATSLGIPKQGMISVRLDSGGVKTFVSYCSCSDGRIILLKNDWSNFVARSSLELNKHVMFSFKATSQPHINVKMVVCKI